MDSVSSSPVLVVLCLVLRSRDLKSGPHARMVTAGDWAVVCRAVAGQTALAHSVTDWGGASGESLQIL